MIYPKYTAANRNRIFENCPFVLPTEFLGPGSSSLALLFWVEQSTSVSIFRKVDPVTV